MTSARYTFAQQSRAEQSTSTALQRWSVSVDQKTGFRGTLKHGPSLLSHSQSTTAEIKSTDEIPRVTNRDAPADGTLYRGERKEG